MLTGQDQNLYFRPRRRKFLRLLSPFWLEEVMVETRLLGNRSCYRKKKKKTLMLSKMVSAAGIEA